MTAAGRKRAARRRKRQRERERRLLPARLERAEERRAEDAVLRLRGYGTPRWTVGVDHAFRGGSSSAVSVALVSKPTDPACRVLRVVKLEEP